MTTLPEFLSAVEQRLEKAHLDTFDSDKLWLDFIDSAPSDLAKLVRLVRKLREQRDQRVPILTYNESVAELDQELEGILSET